MELKPGYVVKVTSRADDGWWYGTRLQPNDAVKNGWFPSNFVQEPEDAMILASTGKYHKEYRREKYLIISHCCRLIEIRKSWYVILLILLFMGHVSSFLL